MIQKRSDNLDNFEKADGKSCEVCRDLLDNMSRFFDMLDSTRKVPVDNWLTVDDIAKELKISKSIVYRLIRKGELEAVNIVETNGEIAKKGHYRIKRSSLNYYLDAKKVKPFPDIPLRTSRIKHYPKVKNIIGL